MFERVQGSGFRVQDLPPDSSNGIAELEGLNPELRTLNP